MSNEFKELSIKIKNNLLHEIDLPQIYTLKNLEGPQPRKDFLTLKKLILDSVSNEFT